MKRLVQLGCALLFLLAAWTAPADELVRYEFDGQVLTPASVDARVTASNFWYASDGTTNFVAGNPGDAFRLTSWPSGAVLDDYFLFTITVKPGYIGTIDSVTFDQERSALDGPLQWVVRYSLDNVNFYTLGTGNTTVGFSARTAAAALPLDVTGLVYVRLYATNAASGSGTWRVDNVALNGTLSIDTGRRIIRARASDGAHSDTWAASTNAGAGTIGVATAKRRSGNWSLGLTGSAAGTTDPNVVFDNVPLTGVLTAPLGDPEPVRLTVAFAADNPDNNDDLYLDLSDDNRVTWAAAGSVKLIDGFGNADVEFDATNAVDPTTVAPNPYVITVGLVQTQLAVRVRFDESVNNNTGDSYYIDDLTLSAIPIPAPHAPVIDNYAPASNISTFGARLWTHVQGGYPYPMQTLFYGPTDGGTNVGAWTYQRVLEEKRWGVYSAALVGLTAGQQYYYRAFASNAHGGAWSSYTSNFVTTAVAPNTAGALYLDSFGIAETMPLSIDRDGNGLSDRWETQYLGGLGNDPGADTDNDGVSNARELIAGTHPGVSNSHLRILVADVESPTSTNFRVTFRGGDAQGPDTFATVGDRSARTYRIGAASSVTQSKALQTVVIDGSTGTNAWTDVNATALYTSRFYHVSVSYGGGSYTNTEEWAMHVQARAAGARYLICVPVNYGSAASNNVNDLLGQQLARGLHANAVQGSADRIEYYDENKQWQMLYLRPNGGEVYWSDDANNPADLQLTPGMGFWVVRGAGAAYRGNTVFGGKSWQASDVTPIAVTIEDGNWNFIGWPLAQPRWHYDLDGATPANQLGFESLATGGVSNGPAILEEGYKGDEIWEWRNNEWYRSYWLMDHISASRNGRWWDRFRNDYANFALEVGRAYYYKHVTNFWGGANFEFTPEAP